MNKNTISQSKRSSITRGEREKERSSSTSSQDKTRQGSQGNDNKDCSSLSQACTRRYWTLHLLASEPSRLQSMVPHMVFKALISAVVTFDSFTASIDQDMFPDTSEQKDSRLSASWRPIERQHNYYASSLPTWEKIHGRPPSLPTSYICKKEALTLKPHQEASTRDLYSNNYLCYFNPNPKSPTICLLLQVCR